MSDTKDLRVTVAIDFGTTFSGFAYANNINPDITVHDSWFGLNNSRKIIPKTNTVIQYGSGWKLVNWGFPALAQDPGSRRKKKHVNTDCKTVELFKLHLADIPDYQKPGLPYGLDYRKAIRDFLAEMKPLIQETLNRRWPPAIKLSQVRFVFSVPAEWKPHIIGILQDCIYDAGYLEKRHSNHNLEFTTEPEAAALYCMKKSGEYKLDVGDTFLIVDCGGGTVDLTMRTLVEGDCISEDTERTGDLCGSTYVDKNFRAFLEKKLGKSALMNLQNKHYEQYQYMIHEFFCPYIKFLFNGDQAEFKIIELDIEKWCPALIDYVSQEIKEEMEEEDWLIEILFQDVFEMFHPVVENILTLINNQLNSSRKKCSAMFMVGGFAESPYLIKMIEERFSGRVPLIAVPQNPITAILRGAVMYGLNKKAVKHRKLTMNYGVEVFPKWIQDVDPKARKTENGRIAKFSCLAKRGRIVTPDEVCSDVYYPVYPDQTAILFKVFATSKPNQRFCDKSDKTGMEEVGKLRIKLPDIHLGIDRPVEFGLKFGELLITATARNKTNGESYSAEFNYVSAFEAATSCN
ncbi:5309_t:CDS:10 [Diversispora eburnea]|uniref:5309_t:CDS:1 n=1 Tax=Diversispora eburnea TaxID=1213867 RepID=A0A9N9GM79_9GLOM|nr:5309_t:CDS:10 [Diversispora eburnea]